MDAWPYPVQKPEVAHQLQPGALSDIGTYGASRFEITRDGKRVAIFDKIEDARMFRAATDLLAILERILGAHDTKNNGAYMGEAVLCHHYAETARAAIAKARGEV